MYKKGDNLGLVRLRLWLLFTELILVGLSFWQYFCADAAANQMLVQNPARQKDLVTLYTSPATITAKRDGENTATIVVRHGSSKFKYRTEFFGADHDPWSSRVKAGVGWKGDYLFVMNDSSGSGWRAATDAVLKLQDGRLVEVGLIARNHQGNDDPLGPGYHDGYFHDLFVKFEGEVGHFASKGIGWRIAMREKRGRFVTDLDRTWLENQATIKSNEDDGQKIFKSNKQDNFTAGDLLARFGENVLIATYCGRTREARALLQRAREVLKPPGLKALAAMQKRLKPGELPINEFNF